MPPLERQYAVLPGMGQSSCTDVMLMIRPPPPCLIICLAAIWVPKKALFRLISQHLLVLLLGGIEHRGTGLDSGVVHHDVQPAERFHGGGDEPLQVGDLADVRLHADGLIAQRRDLPFDLVGRFRMGDVVDHDVRPLPGEFEHNGLTDTAVAAGDNGDFVLQKHAKLLYEF